jgi:hypothetical protein
MTGKALVLEPSPRQIYNELVWEIHLAVNSGDDNARMGLAGMITRRDELAAKLGLTSERESQIHDQVTADSPYRRITP